MNHNGTADISAAAADYDDMSSVSSESSETPYLEKKPPIAEPSELLTPPTFQLQNKSNGNGKDLRFLASSNFSSDSVTEQTLTPASFNQIKTTPRRYSNGSPNGVNTTITSATYQPSSTTRTGRSRPVSTFLMDSNNSIMEDHSELDFASERSNSGASMKHQSADLTKSPMFFSDLPMFENQNQNQYQFRGAAPRSPTTSPSPVRNGRKTYRPKSPVRSSSPTKRISPFNFQPQEMMMMMHSNGSGSSLQVKPAHRKGHKYKHSSVSMNMFQEPPPVTLADSPLKAIPDSYPIPNSKEAFDSITKNQKLRLLWAASHFAASVVVFVTGFRLHISSLSTLAHLIFYDALGSLFVVLVDVMANFEVWNNSSIAYPFGLERLEVLVGFALSASLVMLSFDLFSHFVEEFVLSWVSHDDHAGHEHMSHHVHDESGKIGNIYAYESVLVLALVISLVSSNVILTYDRLNEMMTSTEQVRHSNGLIVNSEQNKSNKSRLMKLIYAWKNYPTHLITITYALFLIGIPMVPETWAKNLTYDINKCATFLVGALICYNGWSLVKKLGGILLCAFPYSDYQYSFIKSKITDQILALECFRQEFEIQRLFITKFSYNLYVAGVSIKMKGADSDEEVRMRFEVARILNREIKELERGGFRDASIEITIDIDRF
ncbi:uncharacterized protein LODBEIA_P50900 [Lodderomyces beijingensis]|uniref:Protein ZRG17 n=1 Tax=Lodderomyces beijingensis TaxID=1775926 RepID=A0ABP0ZUR1_9ASCO